MPRRSSKHTGTKTSPAQQRRNRAQSEVSLSKLFQLNFSSGACLIALAYDPSGYVPVGAYAEQDIVDWMRLARQQLGGAFQYVRTTAEARGDTAATVHRVVVPLHHAEVKRLSAKWEYGPAWAEDVEAGKLPMLAEQFAMNAKADVGRRSWSASKWLKRS